MRAEKNTAALDLFRLAAMVLVVINHTSPLASYSAAGDFWLARVLARLAVPFFLMTSGYFLAKHNWRSLGRFIKKLCLLYGLSVLLYLPLNLYSGHFTGPADFLHQLLTDGTFYHLWYFPAAILGAILARQLSRLGLRLALPIAALLYLIGLGGDSYYGLVTQLPPAKSLYQGIFLVFSYTRNGLFLAPLFLLLGAAGRRWGRKVSALGFCTSLLAMSLEAFWLRSLGVQRHSAMYLALPLCMVFLFSLLLDANRREAPGLRRLSTLVYILHPWCIILVRGGASLLGLEPLFIQNSLCHFAAVLLLSLGLSWLLLIRRPRRPRPGSRAWREVDLEALAHNARILRRALPPEGTLMAVVKADAYGHGAVPAARCLQKTGVRAFAVACLTEGIALRRAGIRGCILILGYTDPAEAPLLARWRLTQVVVDLDHAKALSARGRRVHVHLALDTGMHRLGLPAEDRDAISAVYALPHLAIDGVFSHLCMADALTEDEQRYTQNQLTVFYDTVDWMRAAGFDPGHIHIQASYGIWNLSDQPCSYARAGIALYGVCSDTAPVRRPLDLWPVLSLRARVATVRTLRAGEGAGYGLAFQALRQTRLAVITIGYADGLPRDLAQRGGEVLLHGRRCPMVGRICMDQLLVDVTELPELRPGDIATIIGRDGGCEIRAEELAEHCGTITNELLSRLGGRLALSTQPVPAPAAAARPAAEARACQSAPC